MGGTTEQFPGGTRVNRELSELDLVAQAVAGDMKALEILLARNAISLRQYVEHRMTPAIRRGYDVDDIVQDAQIAAFKAISKFQAKGEGAFWGWLRTIAFNKLKDCGRKMASEPVVDAKSPREEESSMGGPITIAADSFILPDEHAMRGELIQAFNLAVAALNDNWRNLFRLRYYEQLSHSQIAKIAGTTEGAVRSALDRARDRVREDMMRLSLYI